MADAVDPVAQLAEPQGVLGQQFDDQERPFVGNVGTALAAAGAGFEDVVKLTAYLVDWTPAKMPEFLDGAARVFARLGVNPVPPFTGIGVAALAAPDLLVEIEAVAVIN